VLKQYFEYFYKLKSLKEKRAIFKSPLSLYANRWATYKKPTAQTGTFGFCRHTKPTLKNQKSLFFANARTE
jgi:hypothetical protein